MKRTHGRLFAVALAWLLLLSAGAARAQDPELITEDAAVLLESEGQSVLDIRGLSGALLLRAGREGELRYRARTMDNERAEQPVGLWILDSTLMLRPVEGSEGVPVVLEMAVPPGLDLNLEVVDGKLTLSGLYSDIELKGSGLELDLVSPNESVDLELRSSTARIRGNTGRLSLHGQQLQLALEGAVGEVSLELEQSRVELSGISGDIEIEADESHVVSTSISGALDLSADGGTLDLAGCSGGGEMELREVVLELRDSSGELRIHTDAAVTFNGHNGALSILSYGGAVRGQKSSGSLSIEAHDTEVVLENITGASTISGQQLEVRVGESRTEMTISTVSANVLVEKSQSPISIGNEYGDVEVREAKGPVKIVNRDGAVRVKAHQAPLEIQADSEEVVVAWGSVAGKENSKIENTGGDVQLLLPALGHCRLQVEAPRGRIESDLDWLKLSDDGRSASGMMNRGTRPTIHAVSGSGDIVVETLGSGQAGAGQEN